MRVLKIALLVCLFSTAGVRLSAGVLEKTAKIRVDPTVVEHPESVDDKTAGNLIRYNLRAAVRDAHIEEGESSIRTHFVLDEFSSESRVRRVIDAGTGRSTCTVDGKLVFEDATGKELASVKIHVHGSVVPVEGDAVNTKGREVISDFERRLLKEIEALK